MRDTIHSMRREAHSRGVTASNVAVVLLVSITVMSGVAAAQFGSPDDQSSYSDDFEDGDVDGWDGAGISVSNTSVEGDHSLQAVDGAPDSVSEFPRWQSGPVIDLQEEFMINGTSRIDQGDGNRRAGFGQVDSDGTGVMLLFSDEFASTFLATDGTESFNESVDHYDTDYDDAWVNWEMYSAGNGTVYAKVWENGTAEPSSYALERDFGGASGQFRVWSGTTDGNRVVLLDSVTIEGQLSTAENLTIDTGQLLQHGERQPYTVTLETDGGVQDVTDEATVTSLNTSVVTVDDGTNELVATGDESVAARVGIRAEHPDVTGVAYTEVAVAEPTVENLEVLPPVWRIGAFLGDWTIFLLIVATGAGIVGTRIATSFMGLSMMEMVLLIGWFGGYISTGLILTSVFACLFIGLNLAANIDYTVRR